MSVRGAAYPRQERDAYYTPAWVTEIALDHGGPWGRCLWDPACGSGQMLEVFAARGHQALGSDIHCHGGAWRWEFIQRDFLSGPPAHGPADIVTNPPFGPRGRTAVEFVERALKLAAAWRTRVAMLLPVDFDSAKGRRVLFGDCLFYERKIALLERIVWFDRPGASPATNHAWFVWDGMRHAHSAPPIILYAGREAARAEAA